MEMEANLEWTKRMTNRLTIFALEEEDKALFHHSRAERFTAVYLLFQSLVFFFVSSATVYWPWLSLSFTLAYFSSLPRPIASFHRIHDRLDLLAQFQNTRVQNRGFGFGFGSTNFLRMGLLNPQISTPSELRFKMMARRLKTGGFVVLMAVFAAVMSLACQSLPPPAVCLSCVSMDEGMICCSLS